ncbi:hypothetical protein EGI32_11385 [Ferruginibacter sp. HRS2-29]|nr:hypothetical protein [Ferruginibacter sp. HRS2-29]MCP9751559.1 hypothetical protein [Ferruginibacter sp. HRS2-29]MCP9751568.1 hypothetical protein [Ferruginibacter sp. HRS2-29]
MPSKYQIEIIIIILVQILPKVITATTLAYLSSQKQKGSITLLKNNRNAASIYLMGYALEFSFKRKIVNTLAFNRGFPETKSDFTFYNPQIAAFNAISTGIAITQLRQIKNHNLSDLIIFSGAETRIKSSFLIEWLTVQSWNPENRYKIKRYTSDQTNEFIRSAKVIIREIS